MLFAGPFSPPLEHLPQQAGQLGASDLGVPKTNQGVYQGVSGGIRGYQGEIPPGNQGVPPDAAQLFQMAFHTSD